MKKECFFNFLGENRAFKEVFWKTSEKPYSYGFAEVIIGELWKKWLKVLLLVICLFLYSISQWIRAFRRFLKNFRKTVFLQFCRSYFCGTLIFSISWWIALRTFLKNFRKTVSLQFCGSYYCGTLKKWLKVLLLVICLFFLFNFSMN